MPCFFFFFKSEQKNEEEKSNTKTFHFLDFVSLLRKPIKDSHYLLISRKPNFFEGFYFHHEMFGPTCFGPLRLYWWCIESPTTKMCKLFRKSLYFRLFLNFFLAFEYIHSMWCSRCFRCKFTVCEVPDVQDVMFQIFTESAHRPIQSISRNVCAYVVCRLYPL